MPKQLITVECQGWASAGEAKHHGSRELGPSTEQAERMKG
jgi:hypothetical protein